MSKILVETSARHVHLSLDAIDTLFGKGSMVECRAYLERLQKMY